MPAIALILYIYKAVQQDARTRQGVVGGWFEYGRERDGERGGEKANKAGSIDRLENWGEATDSIDDHCDGGGRRRCKGSYPWGNWYVHLFFSS
jgi:hypothetical protein